MYIEIYQATIYCKSNDFVRTYIFWERWWIKISSCIELLFCTFSTRSITLHISFIANRGTICSVIYLVTHDNIIITIYLFGYSFWFDSLLAVLVFWLTRQCRMQSIIILYQVNVMIHRWDTDTQPTTTTWHIGTNGIFLWLQSGIFKVSMLS